MKYFLKRNVLGNSKKDKQAEERIENLIDNLHINLSVGKPVREVAIKLASVFDKDDYHLLDAIFPNDNDMQIIENAATNIQKIVRGWNIRKIGSLERYREWGEFSSIASSSAFTPRSEVVFIGTPENSSNCLSKNSW